jgi:HEAT repeat protein
MFLRNVSGRSTLLWALGCVLVGSCTNAQPGVSIEPLLSVSTPNYTGGLTVAVMNTADEIVTALRPRFPEKACEPQSPLSGELVSKEPGGRAPSFRGLDPTLAALVRALDHPKREVRDVAAYTLGRLGPSAKQVQRHLDAKFAEGSESGTVAQSGWINFAYERVSCERVTAPDIRQALPLELLTQADDQDFVPNSAVLLATLYLAEDVEYPPGLLADMFRNYNPGRRAPGAVPLLARIAQSERLSWTKRVEAVQALAQTDAAELGPAAPVLESLATNEVQELRFYVANALIKLRSEKAIPLLIERVEDGDWPVWERDLCAYGSAALPAEGRLIELASTATWQRVTRAAIATLGCIRSRKAVPALVEMLQSRDWQTVAGAADALGRIGARDDAVTAELRGVVRDHWSIAVRRQAWKALTALAVDLPEPVPFYPWRETNEQIIGGPPGPIDHGLPWCDDHGKYSIDGVHWFTVKWIQPVLQPVPAKFPKKDVLLQGIGTQTFLRTDDGWLFGSNGFESEGVLAHVSDRGVITAMDAIPNTPFGHASVQGIVRVAGRYFAFGFEILKAGDAGVLFEFTRSPAGQWEAHVLMDLPSAPYSHAIAPTGELLLSDGPNDYAIVQDRIVPLKCETKFPQSYFTTH